jgi:hypothetical protein
MWKLKQTHFVLSWRSHIKYKNERVRVVTITGECGRIDISNGDRQAFISRSLTYATAITLMMTPGVQATSLIHCRYYLPTAVPQNPFDFIFVFSQSFLKTQKYNRR